MGSGRCSQGLWDLRGKARGNRRSVAEMSAMLVIIFIAINYNPSGTADGSMIRRANSMTQCHEWQEEYDKAMVEVNDGSSPAFKIRWATNCAIMTPALGVRGGI